MTGIVDSVDVSTEVWGGLVTNLAASDLPHGASPDCQDVQFQIGSVKTRPGVVSQYTLAGNPSVNYLKTYLNLNETQRLLSLDSLGVLRVDSTPGGALSTISSGIIPGSFGKSDSLFAREYLAFGNGTNGLDFPRQYDDLNLDRLSATGPGAAPTVADSGVAGNISAGVHKLTVIFVTRSGCYTKPAAPTSWTAGGGKQAAVTSIPTGPPYVIARILSFTAVAQSSFYHLGPTGLPASAGSNMYIADNVTTSVTVDFSDANLLLGTNDDPLFNQLELPPVLGTIGYSSRLFHWGEQQNLGLGKEAAFTNLTFDGGYGGIPVAANAGPNSPSAAASSGAGTAWTNPGNIFALDGVFATAAIGANSTAQYLQATGFGFAIPANATITGIVVKTYVKASVNFKIADAGGVFLLKAGVAVGLTHGDSSPWTTAVLPHTYGSSSDLWGATWSPADINNANFGAETAAGNSDTVNRTGFVDYISIQVFYTTPSASTIPLGWTAGASSAGAGSALTGAFPVVWGDAFSITGDGATATRGQITQNAQVNYLTNPIILPGVSYGVRARVASAGGLAQGTLHVNLQSTSGGFTTPGLSVQANQTGATYALFTGILTSALVGAIPSDLLLQVYADGTPTNGGTFLIDHIEIYPLSQQFNNSLIMGSKGQLATQGQESYDTTGFIQYNLNDGQSVRACFKIRERFYIVKEHSFGVTQDDGVNEPSLWTVNDVSKQVGTPSVNGVGIGEDWVVIAHRTGLFLYWGGEVLKISEEIQPTWDMINWQFGWTISVAVDIRKRRIYVCAPFGASTTPNKTLVLDYHDVGSDASAIASNPPIHLTYAGTKKAFDRARKWCPWTIPANSIAQIEQTSGQALTYFGSNDGTGNINRLDDTAAVFTDNGATIPSYYVTAAFAELPTEEAKQLRSHRHLYTYLTMFIQGSGTAGLTLFPDSLSNAIAINSVTLSNPAFKDAEMMLNQSTERMFVKVASQGNGQTFDLQRLCVSMKPEPFSIVRGAP